MITASDAAKRIDVYDPLIDKFIEEVLIPTFANTGKKRFIFLLKEWIVFIKTMEVMHLIKR